MSDSKTVKEVVSAMRFTDMPLESMAWQCFIAHLANPEVRNKQNDFSVIVKRSFDAAIEFREEAARLRKENKK